LHSLDRCLHCTDNLGRSVQQRERFHNGIVYNKEGEEELHIC